MRKHISYIFNSFYRAQPMRCDVPSGATDIQEFENLEELKNSQGYKDQIAKQEAEKLDRESE